MVNFTKEEILEELAKSKTDGTELAVQYILRKLKYDSDSICSEAMNGLKVSLRTLKSKYTKKYNAAFRMRDRFIKQNKDWLESEFIVHTDKLLLKQTDVKVRGPGRPKIEFNSKSDRSKRQEISDISANLQHDPQKMILACRYAAKRTKQTDLNVILSKLLKSPEQPMKIRKLLDSLDTKVEIKKKSAEEALAFLLDGPMSKNLYIKMRLASKNAGADIWPSYDHVREAKIKCRPPKETIKISETIAEVELQSLLDHTAKRIIEVQQESITLFLKENKKTEIEILLMCSWGFDGSSGHSAYKQKYESIPSDVQVDDQNLFATTLVPLRMTTDNNIILWNNKCSQSERFCRPIKLQFAKETKDIILKQKSDIENQINKLQVCEITLDENYRIFVHFSLFLTLLDGKVLNIICGTKSMQNCPICQATPKTFNDFSNKEKDIFLPNSNSLQYGISPLHSWIRLFECCLNISKRLDVKAWQMRTQLQKDSFAARKSLIQATLWEEFGLKVDKPKPGGSGTTNDGNTARRAFANPKLFAKCLGLNSQLVCNFQTILIALSSNIPIDPIKFEKLTTATGKIYIHYYYWFPMPATLHKILCHGSQIMSSSLLPLGMLGEEASEARNKNYKNYRQSFSRKHNHRVNLEDVFYRVMDTSDPKISSMNLPSRLKYKQSLTVPEAVMNLFCDVHVVNDNIDLDDDNDNEDENDLTGISRTLAQLDETELSDDEDS